MNLNIFCLNFFLTSFVILPTRKLRGKILKKMVLYFYSVKKALGFVMKYTVVSADADDGSIS